jgi:hypothetical protein
MRRPAVACVVPDAASGVARQAQNAGLYVGQTARQAQALARVASRRGADEAFAPTQTRSRVNDD